MSANGFLAEEQSTDQAIHPLDMFKGKIEPAVMHFHAKPSLRSGTEMMKIEIKADKDAILGGPELIAYLKLELGEDGHAVLQASHRPSGRIPTDEWSGRLRAWSASLSPGSYAIADLAAMEGLAQRLSHWVALVAAGHSWDGSNHDAREASVEIEKILHAAQWWDQQREVWDADDWFFELGYLGAAKDYGLGVHSSEAAYKAAEKKIEADALQYGVVLINTDAVLRHIRQALQAEAKEDA